ncbi:hypothetical protein D9757_009343 [Collybiopsis confluens]|uniref:Carboxylic ester hydrolase n=1 Tax=Collybiopsis confluens TaxID=2823264 RepID=A0A8H5H4B0_9AGAR|nr:hypothetical protein D9757_009343 [Collybiopsis confluens]
MFQDLLDTVSGVAQFLGLSLFSINGWHRQPPLWTPAYAANLTNGDLDFVANCSRFSALVDIPGAVTHFTQYVPAGTNLLFPDNHPSCGLTFQSVSSDICRLAMSVPTSSTSEISFEAWFPRNYSGRFLSTGNRGVGGCIPYDELAYTTSMGFASVGTNSGHNTTSADAFLNNPDAVQDFAYRSVHTGTIVGKELTSHFYGYPYAKSYYFGCSTGGRQGFKEAQDFPEDFDGILAGAPAIAFTRLVSWGASFLQKTASVDDDTFVTPELWAIVYEALLQQCDALDGAVDGLLEHPDLCQFNPEVLLCRKGRTSGCLTGKQAERVRAVFSPLYGREGQLLYPRLQPGVNTKKQMPFYVAGVPFGPATEWFQNVVYNDTTWDPRSFSLQDAMVAIEQNPFDIDTWNGNLTSFATNGGKLLTFHGLQDFVISSEISSLYYAHVARTMGFPPAELDNFYRLFFVSGMDHCQGGDGASVIGQSSSSSVGANPDENVLMALVRWVEEGVAPEVLKAAKLDKKGAVGYWRSNCKWPLKNRYHTEEGSWKCE